MHHARIVPALLGALALAFGGAEASFAASVGQTRVVQQEVGTFTRFLPQRSYSYDPKTRSTAVTQQQETIRQYQERTETYQQTGTTSEKRKKTETVYETRVVDDFVTKTRQEERLVDEEQEVTRTRRTKKADPDWLPSGPGVDAQLVQTTLAQYRNICGRDPEPAGFYWWLGNGGGSDTDIQTAAIRNNDYNPGGYDPYDVDTYTVTRIVKVKKLVDVQYQEKVGTKSIDVAVGTRQVEYEVLVPTYDWVGSTAWTSKEAVSQTKWILVDRLYDLVGVEIPAAQKANWSTYTSDRSAGGSARQTLSGQKVRNAFKANEAVASHAKKAVDIGSIKSRGQGNPAGPKDKDTNSANNKDKDSLKDVIQNVRKELNKGRDRD